MPCAAAGIYPPPLYDGAFGGLGSTRPAAAVLTPAPIVAAGHRCELLFLSLP